MAAIQDLVEGRSADLRTSYDQMTLGMQGAWLGFTQNMASQSVARLQLTAQLGELVRSYGPLMRGRARDAVIAAYAQGVTDARGTLDPTAAPLNFIEEAQSNLDAAAARDARGVAILGSQVLIRYGLARQRMDPATARLTALGDLPGQGRDVFVQLDRLQRKRASGEFVSASTRMVMFATYFHGFTAALSAIGERAFMAIHPERPPAELDLLEGWSEWAAASTHPNTRWSLTRKDPA